MNDRMTGLVDRETPADVIRDRRTMTTNPSFDIGVGQAALFAASFQSRFADDPFNVGASQAQCSCCQTSQRLKRWVILLGRLWRVDVALAVNLQDDLDLVHRAANFGVSRHG